ncbi:MAG: hypothetical protein HZB26_16860 [Candidatus Hydrogenedentes bacterium]|nr:hypothetical protein [Candidatus Hydrogenedentota bacterium]
MTHEFEELKHKPYPPEVDPLDAEALRFTKSWHRYPGIHSAIWYHGVNLGEVDEYMLICEVITALVEREQGRIR